MFSAKKYNSLHYIILPFKTSPVLCSSILLHKLIMSLIPSFSVLVLANFVNTAIGIFNGVNDIEKIYLLFFLYALTIIYSWIMGVVSSFAHKKLSMNMELVLKGAIIKKRASMDYKYVEDENTWDLIKRVGGDTHQKILSGFNNIISVLYLFIEIISIVAVLASFIWWSAIPTLLFGIPIYIISKKYGEKDYLIKKEAQKFKRRADVYERLLTSRENIEERAMFSYSNEINERWHNLYEKARRITQKATINHYKKRTLLHVLSILGTLTVSALVVFPLAEGKINIGEFTALFTAVYTLERLISWQLSRIVYNYSNSKRYLIDFTEFMNLTETKGATDRPIKYDEKLEKIEFRNVTFKYPNSDVNTLENMSMILKGDKHYSFVGKNGAGKTTITKLLTGMYDNYEGEILINNKNLRDFTQSELKGIFSVVYQDYAKYEISLRESISLGNINSCDENDIIEAIQTVKLDEEMSRFKNGLDTPIGKTRVNGTDISGGQWQRIALARNIVSQCPVQILDEPTSALDPISERNIYHLFSNISKSNMTIFITHRLGAALLADEILVLDDGKIVERGSHVELILQNGLYTKMYNSQKSWYEE